MLERTYDNLFRIWLQDGGTKPSASTSDQLRISYSGTLNPLKSLSDQVISLPMHSELTDEQIDFITDKVIKFLA